MTKSELAEAVRIARSGRYGQVTRPVPERPRKQPSHSAELAVLAMAGRFAPSAVPLPLRSAGTTCWRLRKQGLLRRWQAATPGCRGTEAVYEVNAKGRQRLAALRSFAAPDGSAKLCQYKGCSKPAEVEVSGLVLSKPGWWRMCATHRRVFAAQRPLSPNESR